MNKEEYRKRKVANDFARKNGLRPAQGYKCIDVVTKICSVLGPLTDKQRGKCWRMLMIALEDEK